MRKLNETGGVNGRKIMGIDGSLVIGAEEEVYELNNGCVCCKLRGDLIRVAMRFTSRRWALACCPRARPCASAWMLARQSCSSLCRR